MDRTSCENALARLHGASKTQLHAVQHFFARQGLEANLAALLETARGHEAHNVPAGSAQYSILQRQAEGLIEAYCGRWRHCHRASPRWRGWHLTAPRHG